MVLCSLAYHSHTATASVGAPKGYLRELNLSYLQVMQASELA